MANIDFFIIDFYDKARPEAGSWFISLPHPLSLLDKQEEGVFIFCSPLPRVFSRLVVSWLPEIQGSDNVPLVF